MEKLNTRYARHYSLKDFGVEGQQKLKTAKVLVIGAGGLGCPVLQYLAAAGLGTIGIADGDIIALSNLQRQILYTTDDIGKPKTEAAASRLESLNPEIVIKTYNVTITSANALEIISNYDLVVDCTDNFTARYLINDACVVLGKGLVFGAIYQYEGQVAVFNINDSEGNKTNYRHLFPTPPKPQEVPDCNETGVIGVLPGIIGVIQASEVIKLIVGIGDLLISKLLTFSLLNYSTFIIDITEDDSVNAMIPQNTVAFKETDYSRLCGMSVSGIEELDVSDFLKNRTSPDTIFIDVRESHELLKSDFPNVNIPLSSFSEKIPELTASNIILFCQSGKRSLKAGEMLLKKFGTSKKISHLKGGINALQER